MSIINLTPHDINVYEGNNLIATYPRTGNVARISSKSVKLGALNGVPLFETQYGLTEGLPEKQHGTFLVVSALVRNQNPQRTDLLSPSGLVRDEKGVIIGCLGFDVNK